MKPPMEKKKKVEITPIDPVETFEEVTVIQEMMDTEEIGKLIASLSVMANGEPSSANLKEKEIKTQKPNSAISDFKEIEKPKEAVLVESKTENPASFVLNENKIKKDQPVKKRLSLGEGLFGFKPQGNQQKKMSAALGEMKIGSEFKEAGILDEMLEPEQRESLATAFQGMLSKKKPEKKENEEIDIEEIQFNQG